MPSEHLIPPTPLESCATMPEATWDLAKAKLAVKQLAAAADSGSYPLEILESGECPEGLVDFIRLNYNSIRTFAEVVRMPIRGTRRIPNSQFAWSDEQIAQVLCEVSKIEKSKFLPTNACLRERGLRWVEQFISGRSFTFSELTGLQRSTFSQRAARRDRKSYHKTWTLPDAIKTTRSLAQSLHTGGFMPTQKQFRAHKLNWLSSLISQKFGGIEQFAAHCGLKLRRMSQGRRLRKPRHLLRRAARTPKGLKMLWDQLRMPGQSISPAQRALCENILHAPLPAISTPRKRPMEFVSPQAVKRIKIEPRW